MAAATRETIATAVASTIPDSGSCESRQQTRLSRRRFDRKGRRKTDERALSASGAVLQGNLWASPGRTVRLSLEPDNEFPHRERDRIRLITSSHELPTGPSASSSSSRRSSSCL